MSLVVTIAPNNYQIQVEPGETILAAGLRQGADLIYGCRSGLCGTCVAELLHGEVTYPNGIPSALQNQPLNSCLLCQAVPLTAVHCKVAEHTGSGQTSTPRLLSCQVAHCEQVAPDVVRLLLKLPEATRLQFQAGQYLEIILDDDRRRAFSIANAPNEDTLIELHIRRVPGGIFTDRSLAQLTIGESLQVYVPLGSFTLRAAARPLLFIAGGTGFAPVKSLIEQVLQEGTRFPIYLYWGVRARRDLYLRALPERWASEHPQFYFVPVLSDPDQDWEGRTGFVHQAVCADQPDPSGFDVYLAGPPVMVEAARTALATAGLAPEHIFADAFEYAANRS